MSATTTSNSTPDRGREVVPHDPEEVADSADTVDRLGDHRRRADDAAAIGTGDSDDKSVGARDDD